MHASYCLLADMGVFEVTGTDARSFLHGQLSIDVEGLSAEAAPLAAWSAANGRVRLLVRLAVADAGYLLLAPASMTETITRKLGLFVLRARVTIAPSAALVAGAVVDATPDWLAERGLTRPSAPDRSERVGATLWLHAGSRLSYVVGTAADLDALAAAAAAAPPEAVEQAEIELGLPRVVPDTAERFLPQMLDLDRLGGVAFDKGCFPGQEVIARTQNLGTVKRRLKRFTVDGPAPAPGTLVYAATGDDAGRVLRSARHADRTELLAVVRLDAPTGPLRAAAPDGPPLTELPFARERP